MTVDMFAGAGRSQLPSGPPRLPLELQEAILCRAIEYTVENDTEHQEDKARHVAVLRWMTLSKALLPCLRAQLYSDITVVSHETHKLQSLAQTLSIYPDLANHVHKLTIVLAWKGAPDDQTSAAQYDQAIFHVCRPVNVFVYIADQDLVDYATSLPDVLYLTRTKSLKIYSVLRGTSVSILPWIRLLDKASKTLETFDIEGEWNMKTSELDRQRIPSCPNLRSLRNIARLTGSGGPKKLSDILLELHADQFDSLSFRGYRIDEPIVAITDAKSPIKAERLKYLELKEPRVKPGHLSLLRKFSSLQSLSIKDYPMCPTTECAEFCKLLAWSDWLPRLRRLKLDWNLVVAGRLTPEERSNCVTALERACQARGVLFYSNLRLL